MKKAESAKIINLVIENKEKLMKSTFLENFKGRVKIENVLRKYVRGYSKDRIRRKKIEDFYKSNFFQNSNYDSNRSLINSPYLSDIEFKFNNNNNQFTYPEFYKEENKNYSNSNSNNNKNNSIKNSVHYRLNNQTIGTMRRNGDIDLIPSKEIKEKKDIEECSFQPKINNFNPNKFNTLNNFYIKPNDNKDSNNK
jgi:hypothetical protein